MSFEKKKQLAAKRLSEAGIKHVTSFLYAENTNLPLIGRNYMTPVSALFSGGEAEKQFWQMIESMEAKNVAQS